MSVYDAWVSQKFFSKKSVDGSRTFPYSTTQSEKERVMASFAFFSREGSGDSVCINIDQIAYFTASSLGTGGTTIHFSFAEEGNRPWRIDVSGDVNATERQIMRVHKRFGNDLNLTWEPAENFVSTTNYAKYRDVDA